MYVRPTPKYPSGLRLPENYSGNTFREPARIAEEPEEQEPSEDAVSSAEQDAPSPPTDEATALLPHSPPHPEKRFSLLGKGGFASEEFLILALILLISDKDGNDDLLLFLMLLLFIK